MLSAFALSPLLPVPRVPLPWSWSHWAQQGDMKQNVLCSLLKTFVTLENFSSVVLNILCGHRPI